MLFERQSSAPPGIHFLPSDLPDYNVFLLYGLTCDKYLADERAVREELNSNYCPLFWIRKPHCETHQLMGLLWALKNRCDGAEQGVASEVIRSVRRNLALDFRIDDAFIQRALMLAETGDWRANLKAVWISRILDAQLPDGGWDFDARVLPLTSSNYVVTEKNSITIRAPASSFHTTAQAVLLIAHILNQKDVPDTNLASWYKMPIVN
jgi:hypothetical protein